jgi:hypothetical protein
LFVPGLLSAEEYQIYKAYCVAKLTALPNLGISLGKLLESFADAQLSGTDEFQQPIQRPCDFETFLLSVRAQLDFMTNNARSIHVCRAWQDEVSACAEYQGSDSGSLDLWPYGH